MSTTLDDVRFLRLSQIVPGLVPVGKSTWWAGVKTGRFPKPLKLSQRVTVWRASDIRDFLEKRDNENSTKTNAQEFVALERSKNLPPRKAVLLNDASK